MHLRDVGSPTPVHHHLGPVPLGRQTHSVAVLRTVVVLGPQTSFLVGRLQTSFGAGWPQTFSLTARRLSAKKQVHRGRQDTPRRCERIRRLVPFPQARHRWSECACQAPGFRCSWMPHRPQPWCSTLLRIPCMVQLFCATLPPRPVGVGEREGYDRGYYFASLPPPSPTVPIVGN